LYINIGNAVVMQLLFNQEVGIVCINHWKDLSPGIYFCRMTSGGFTATKRFVVEEKLPEF
jgi:hypothetical protein